MRPPEPSTLSIPTEEQWRILEFIQKNPLAGDEELAIHFGMSVDSIQRRLTPLRDNHWIETKRIVDWAAVGYRLKYRIDVKIDPLALQQKLTTLKDAPISQTDNPQKILAGYIKNKLAADKAFADIVIVEDVVILLGEPADLSITVRVREPEDVFDWVTAGLRAATPGIESTSTCLEAWSILDGKLSEKKSKRFRGSRG